MLFEWLRRRSRGGEQPLERPPRTPRTKTFSADSGYVYQHRFEGMRSASDGTEYVFAVTSNRSVWQNVTVRVTRVNVQDWETVHGRALASNERYAIAKMALFEALDQRRGGPDSPVLVEPRAGDIERFLASLGLD